MRSWLWLLKDVLLTVTNRKIRASLLLNCNNLIQKLYRELITTGLTKQITKPDTVTSIDAGKDKTFDLAHRENSSQTRKQPAIIVEVRGKI